MVSLKNQTIFITGASGGIGMADALKFAEEGCRLVLTYLKHKKEARSVCKKCLELGSPEVLLLPLDLRSNRSIRKASDKAIKRFNSISVLVNNAAVIQWKLLEQQNFESIEDQVRINLEGLIKITKVLTPHIERMIINMGSASSMPNNIKAEQIVYGAAKWGVRGFTKALAKEYLNLKVYNFVSGGVATQMKNYKGISPDKIAQLILDFAREKYTSETGSDINARDYIDY